MIRRLVLSLAAVAASMTAAAAQEAVTFIPAAETAKAFAKGQPLKETGTYKVYASRRDAPGSPEVHERDTDIIYVLEGRATIVTGGRVVNPKTTAVNEIRGTAIEGGDTRELTKGDFLIVPNGVPHWFSKVDAPLLYYTVKSTAATDR
jgi:mannose-6-phosphate isomerase-like protein (cupin superfamily)